VTNQTGAQLVLAAYQQRTAPQAVPSVITKLADLGAQAMELVDLLQQPIAANEQVIDIRKRPQMIKLNADGAHLPDRDDVDPFHVATLLPQFGLIFYASKPEKANNWDAAREKAKQIVICGEKADGLPEACEFELIIDRKRNNPAVDIKYFPRIRTDDWYWTSEPHPSDSSCAFFVLLNYGLVGYYYRYGSGLVLACRRVSPRQ